ncbi:MAG: hypothetical protein PVI92_17190 [Chromatiales bacterium]|jgi:hypothetical protein
MTISSKIRHSLVTVQLGITLIISPAYAEDESGKTGVEYTASNDSLSIDVQDAELNTVLMHIASQADIRVLVGSDVKGLVTTSFSQRPMRDALDSLLVDYNVITFYEKQDAPGGELRVSELRILPSGKEDNSMLRSIEDLQQDLQRQNKMLLRANATTKSERKRAKEEAKLEQRLKDFESLKESDPELYEKKIERLRKRHYKTVELLGENEV